MISLAGFLVHESAYATQTVPVRQHRRRRNQSAAYHRRIQKKWTKRFGTRQVQTAYMIDNGVIGGRGRTLVAHPDVVAELRRLSTVGVPLRLVQPTPPDDTRAPSGDGQAAP